MGEVSFITLTFRIEVRAFRSSSSMEFKQEFQACQVVYLEYEATRLYTEVIQIIEDRQICWVRPLGLVVQSSHTTSLDPSETTFYDLRQSADLLWPLALFRPAIDTEVIPLLAYLATREPAPETNRIAHQQLSQFIWQSWQLDCKQL